jgi:hypothetical protein
LVDALEPIGGNNRFKPVDGIFDLQCLLANSMSGRTRIWYFIVAAEIGVNRGQKDHKGAPDTGLIGNPEVPMAKLNASKRADLTEKQFAFPAQRKEPLENATHVRNAVARFDQVDGVTDAERDAAWKRIRVAAKKYGVEIHQVGWRQLGAGSKR